MGDSRDLSVFRYVSLGADTANARRAALRLETLFGSGPVGSPYLYDQADPAKLLLGADGRDVPRNQQGIALIGDPRNDVHAFMTGLQVALIDAHNELVDRLRAAASADGADRASA